MAAGFPLAACILAFHLSLLLSPSSALPRLSETESSVVRHGVGIRPAYHFLPAKNWQNDPNDSRLGPVFSLDHPKSAHAHDCDRAAFVSCVPVLPLRVCLYWTSLCVAM
ncbi:hypothetical protein TRIUR3_07535 [Triticum urartu]|uniref:Uncharacterized protein n=1 Tax=Triticum urartu TaxID=4572 RepID=M8AAE6_TRIUA|nr:hypothetical protein TRIUR3_07535 [Triticum urartu]